MADRIRSNSGSEIIRDTDSYTYGAVSERVVIFGFSQRDVASARARVRKELDEDKAIDEQAQILARRGLRMMEERNQWN